VTKAPKIKKEFGLIDWTKPAEYVERFVRAMQPWPTAYTFLHRPGKEPIRVIIAKTNSYLAIGMPSWETSPPPGKLVGNLPFGTEGERLPLTVYCGKWQLLIVDELQPAGKKRMTAEEFLRGHPIVEGMRFGPEVLT